MCDNDMEDSYFDSEGNKITRKEFENTIKKQQEESQKVLDKFICDNSIENNLAKRVLELEKKLIESNKAFDYVKGLLISTLESLKPK